MDKKVTLGYWGIRGLGQVPRLLLAYTGAVWEDKKYTDQALWFGKDKDGLGLDFPNLPYLIDGDFKLTESQAIQKYIIERSNSKELLGKSPRDRAFVDMLISVLTDCRSTAFPLLWDKEYESKLAAAADKIRPKLEQLSKFIGDKPFALGYVTLVDFMIAELSHYFFKLFPAEFAKHSFFARIKENFEALGPIKNYYEQETAVKGPHMPPSAVVKLD